MLWRRSWEKPSRSGKVARVRTQIVVPCYNEAARLQSAAFDQYLAASKDVGFVLVNDGSSDGTLAVLRELETRWPGRVQVLDQQPNQGKAEAVRVGMLQAMHGDASYVGYFDADLATPLEAIPQFIDTLDEEPAIDIVIGARVALLGRDIERRALRHYLGRIFATAASLVLGLPVYDTQCGAKLIRNRGPLRALFERPFGSRWIFDVELLARYLEAMGSRAGLYELPLRRWQDVGESHVKPKDFLRAGGEMSAIYREYRLHHDLRFVLGVLSAPFVRYVTVGGLGTAVHYATLAAAVELGGATPTVGTVLGATVGAAVNYVLNYHFTFASKASHSRTLPRFLGISTLSLGLNGGGMWYAVHRLHVHYLLAQLLCTGAVLVIGYVLNKLWTFRAPAPEALRASAPLLDAATVTASASVESEQPERAALQRPES